jgi:hypothetical protein
VSPAAVEAQRRLEVRQAASGWRRAGAIDEATHTAIDAQFPDDRGRLGRVFRILAFIFSGIAVLGAFGLLLLGSAPTAPAAFFFGLVLWGLTELQVGPLRRSQGGIEAATGALSIVFLVCGLILSRHQDSTVLALSAATLLLACAAWRWEGSFWAGAGVFCFFGLLAQNSSPRLAWLAAGLLLVVPFARGCNAARLAPAHRRACQAALFVSILALYLSVNLASWDKRFIEGFYDAWPRPEPAMGLRPLAIVGTALVTIGLLAWGLIARRRLLLNLGLLGALASLATLRSYVSLGPPSLALIAGGAGAIGIALAVRRFLDSAPGQERGGFTAEPLFEDRSRWAEIAASAALSAKPRASTPEGAGFEGGGGSSGGGGASDSF